MAKTVGNANKIDSAIIGVNTAEPPAARANDQSSGYRVMRWSPCCFPVFDLKSTGQSIFREYEGDAGGVLPASLLDSVVDILSSVV
jgi:hypothetical protein